VPFLAEGFRGGVPRRRSRKRLREPLR